MAECPNRVMLLIDEAAQRLRTFATYPKPSGTTNAGTCTTSGGAIYEKSTPLDTISFTTDKTPRIVDADQYVHNVSSTKQNLNSSRTGTLGSGLLLLAASGATQRYWHHYDGGASAAPTDTTPPRVTGVTPAAGATGVATKTKVTATFSEALDPVSVSGATFTLSSSKGPVAAAVAYDPKTGTATLKPKSALSAGTVWTARLVAGSAGVRDVAGNPLADPFSWTFTTKAS